MMLVVRFAIHDECGNPSAKALLARFLPSVGASMARRLGAGPSREIHVVL
jgi:hypothetical protein